MNETLNVTIASLYIYKALLVFHTLLLINKKRNFSLTAVQLQLPGKHKYWLFLDRIHVMADLVASGSSTLHHRIRVFGELQQREV